MDKKEADKLYEDMRSALEGVHDDACTVAHRIIAAAIDPPAKAEAPELEWVIELQAGGQRANVFGRSARKGSASECIYGLDPKRAADIVNRLNAAPAMAEACEWLARNRPHFSIGDKAKAALALYGAYGPDGKRREIGVDDGT